MSLSHFYKASLRFEAKQRDGSVPRRGEMSQLKPATFAILRKGVLAFCFLNIINL